MISLSALNRGLFGFFRIAAKDGAQLKVYYGTKVYLVTIEPTGEKYKRVHYKRPKTIKTGVQIKTSMCRNCGGVKISEICTNRFCSSNKKPAPE